MEAHVAAAYATLGLAPGATDRDVKEAYRRLVLLHHPDRAPAANRAAAETAFLRVRGAYDSLLSRSAGYSAPPPGSAPSAAHAEAWWHAHSADGRVPWGRYNGYETEKEFYRAMARSGRSSLLWLSAAGLLGVPVITALSMAAQSLRNSGTGGSKHRRRDAGGEARGWGVTAGGLAAVEAAAEASGAEAAAGAASAPTSATGPGAEEHEDDDDDDDGGRVAVLGLDSLRAQMRVNGGVALSSPFAATTALDRHALLRRQDKARRERVERGAQQGEGAEGPKGENVKGGEAPKGAAGAAASAG